MELFNLGLGAALVYEVQAKFSVLVFIILIFLIISWHLRISVYRVLRGEGPHSISAVVAVSSSIRQWGELMGPQKWNYFLGAELHRVQFLPLAWDLPYLKSALPYVINNVLCGQAAQKKELDACEGEQGGCQ